MFITKFKKLTDMSCLDPIFFILLMTEYTSSEVVEEGSMLVVVGSIKFKY